MTTTTTTTTTTTPAAAPSFDSAESALPATPGPTRVPIGALGGNIIYGHIDYDTVGGTAARYMVSLVIDGNEYTTDGTEFLQGPVGGDIPIAAVESFAAVLASSTLRDLLGVARAWCSPDAPISRTRSGVNCMGLFGGDRSCLLRSTYYQ